MRHPVRAAGLIVCYFLLAIGPLLLSLIQLDPGRGFWVNFSVALGFVGLALMGLQFVLAARAVRISQTVGIDVVLQVHRQMTWLIAVFIFGHPIILFFWDHRYLALLNVISSPVRAKFAVASVLLLLALIVTSVWRQRLRLSYQNWQMLHAILATLIVVTGLVHVLLIGYYVDQPWERALWIAYSAAFIAIAVWVRVIRPILRWQKRWQVVSVEPEPGPAHTVSLELVNPKAYGNGGFRFEPGQFAWIHVGRSPFAMEYHPFSISSSAEHPERLQFTIKTESRFTARVEDFQPGQVVYLDGPWGHFSLERHEGPGFVFIAAGVGVTPMLSMAATLADRDDKRPCWMIVGNRSQSSMTCSDDIAETAQRMPNLTVVHVLSRPEPGWTGRVGHIDKALLDAVLPPNRQRLQYFLCGPDRMMDAVEEALAHFGVPADQIHAERFAMA